MRVPGFVLLLPAALAGFAPSCTAADLSDFALRDARVTLPDRVLPGQAFDVQVTAKNTGDVTWNPGEVTLRGDVAWQIPPLVLSAPAAPGIMATFSGALVAPFQTGIHPLMWHGAYAGEPFGPTILAHMEVTCSDGVFCNGTERLAGGACVPGIDPCDDGQDCTQDSCDESAGTCTHTPGASCASCRPVCIPDCTGKVCGDSGCGTPCGDCADGSLCVPATGQCQVPADCNHLLPACMPACAAGQFCGSDCACHALAAPMPDIVIDRQRLADEILFDTIDVDSASCTLVEGCVVAAGTRRVVRFSVEAINQGRAPLAIASPKERPDLFTFSPCHGHYHFKGFATYALLDKDGKEVVAAQKQAYCIGDSRQVMLGPAISCDRLYDCDMQSLQAGWSDLYGNGLDCQWLDITDVAPGDYTIQVVVNPGKVFEEASFDNNTASVPVTIAAP